MTPQDTSNGLTSNPQQPQPIAGGQQQHQPAMAGDIQQTGGPMGGMQPQAQQSSQPQQQSNPPQLDDNFLKSIGLGVIPEAERIDMLKTMEKTLQMNVGIEIYKNLQEEQIREFEGFTPVADENGNVLVSEEEANINTRNWLNVNLPGYQNDPNLQQYLSSADGVRKLAAMNWLHRNFPTYRDVVTSELNKLMDEVRNNVPQIIAAVQG
jgi:hypothetical protein